MEKIKESEKGKFVGIAPLTGQKIYLTSEEEKIIKNNIKKSFNVFWWIIGIFVFLSRFIKISVTVSPLISSRALRDKRVEFMRIVRKMQTFILPPVFQLFSYYCYLVHTDCRTFPPAHSIPWRGLWRSKWRLFRMDRKMYCWL